MLHHSKLKEDFLPVLLHGMGFVSILANNNIVASLWYAKTSEKRVVASDGGGSVRKFDFIPGKS